ncbi:PREDICTED: uncharacterized protein LOC108567118 [Nicrophorus vespilloides]|uniref:Uncharacterized protein LOC108567118 n=1 Tax=Nicrophorus vespilloides TaxID=110193 RepID=A0ABM1N7S9_NICVS|nr:PREDICTED: uncharacterized protein LOC108567118 [Nicrophorus vespilloides]
MQEIKDLDVLLKPCLGSKKISSYTTRNLIAAGENYGSIMLAVDVKIRKDNQDENEDETVNLVAKLCPPTEFIKKMFNIPITYKKEVGFYSTVIPTLQQFQIERGIKKPIDFFPKYFGSRINLNGFSEVDDDACLLLENIKVKGFDIVDRLQGFDIQSAEYIIKDLATFHAVPIALKMIKPDVFAKKVLPYLGKHMEADTISEEMNQSMMKSIIEGTEKNNECAKYKSRVLAAMKRNSENFVNQTITVQEPFATIVHSDYWVNNTMLKFENGRPIANAIVDFQLIVYGNPAHDLLFFIYSSLNNHIIDENYQRLVDLYYDTFIRVLEDLKVDTTPFGYDVFLKQIEFAATELQFYHIMFMLKPIFTDKKKVKQLSDINENEMSNTDDISEMYYPKLWSTILDFAKRNWI